jgi:DNA/RNA-binding domain of Phe-tRNA-synthetase-like protein
MLSITATDNWRISHPGAVIGLLELSDVDNTRSSPKLDAHKRETEARLRGHYAGYTRQDFLSLPVMTAYQKYYKRFTKTYHVLLQLESIVLKGKSLPDVSPLVDSNFIAEVDTLVLTAGHDVAKLVSPVVMDVSQKGDQIIRMSGDAKLMEVGDMVMRDATGVVCSIIYGQDNVSPITSATAHVIYVAYAPVGVLPDAVEHHLRMIEENVRVFSPSIRTEQLRLLSA